MAQEESSGAPWISIPSIPPGRVGLGALAFFTALAAAIAIDLLLIRHNHQPAAWQLAAEMVFDDGSAIVGWALAATWPIMEVFRMVLAGIYERRNRRRARAEGRAEGRVEGHAEGRVEGLAEGRVEGLAEGHSEGRAEANSAWRDWVQRKEAAAERGEPFNEPMPDGADANGGQA